MRDWFAAKKKVFPAFSFRYFARKSGLSASFISSLASGTRNCSVESARQIAAAIGLNKHESEFFESLALGNGAMTAMTSNSDTGKHSVTGVRGKARSEKNGVQSDARFANQRRDIIGTFE